MSESTNKVAALRAQLAEAEKVEKAEKAAERAKKDAERRAKTEADTDAFREENYELVAGPHDSYVGVTSDYSGRVELSLNEYTSFCGSASLTHEEARTLAEGILGIVG